MSLPTDYGTVNITLKCTKACINVLGQIYASAYFDMGLLTEALAKHINIGLNL